MCIQYAKSINRIIFITQFQSVKFSHRLLYTRQQYVNVYGTPIELTQQHGGLNELNLFNRIMSIPESRRVLRRLGMSDFNIIIMFLLLL